MIVSSDVLMGGSVQIFWMAIIIKNSNFREFLPTGQHYGEKKVILIWDKLFKIMMSSGFKSALWRLQGSQGQGVTLGYCQNFKINQEDLYL